MKKLFIMLLLLSGCASGYKSQRLYVPAHKVIIHESREDMQKAFAAVTGERNESVGGFFSVKTDTIHCYKPFPEECLLHEYKHLLSKYGLFVPDKHFNKGAAK